MFDNFTLPLGSNWTSKDKIDKRSGQRVKKKVEVNDPNRTAQYVKQTFGLAGPFWKCEKSRTRFLRTRLF